MFSQVFRISLTTGGLNFFCILVHFMFCGFVMCDLKMRNFSVKYRCQIVFFSFKSPGYYLLWPASMKKCKIQPVDAFARFTCLDHYSKTKLWISCIFVK